MRKLSCLLFIFLFVLTACVALKADSVDQWWINSARVDCVGVAPMTCYRIQPNENIDPEGWQLFYSDIKGFNYQPGYIYQVKVRVTDRPEPVPADASAKLYELVEVMSKEPDPGLRITNIWKVVKVGDRMNPTVNDSSEPLIFEFNATRQTYYGSLGCNTTRGAIKTNDGENLLLGPGATTMMACIDMELEQAMAKALMNTRRYAISDRLLRFYDAEGNELIAFQAVD